MQTFFQHPSEPTPLRAMRSGLRCLKEEQRRASASLGEALDAELSDYVTCMEHELNFFEEYPASTLRATQQKRVEQLCHHAMNLLPAPGRGDGTASALEPLRSAIAQLLLSIQEDFGKLGRQRSPNAVHSAN